MKPSEKISELIERIGRTVSNAQNAEGFKPVQWESLRYLDQANVFSRNPGSLGEYLGVTKGSVSQTLSTLEQRRLITKKTDKRDKRVVRLELTAAGRAVVANNPLRELAATVETISAKRQQQLVTELEALLVGHLDQRGRRPFGQCSGCRHLLKNRNRFHCGLLDEPLKGPDTHLICAEFEAP